MEGLAISMRTIVALRQTLTLMAQASAKWVMVQSNSFSAISVNLRIFSILAWVSGLLSFSTVSLKNSGLVAYRESLGTSPELYFPVNWKRRRPNVSRGRPDRHSNSKGRLTKPEARGDQMVVPNPLCPSNKGLYSTSNFSLCNIEYWGCSQVGPIRLSLSAIA